MGRSELIVLLVFFGIFVGVFFWDWFCGFV